MCYFCHSNNIIGPPPEEKHPGEPSKYVEGYGLTRSICSKLLFHIEDRFFSRYDPAYRGDYARMLSVLMDVDLVRAKLAVLNQSIAANANSATPEVNWLRLSSILSYFENKCGFFTDILLPMGILTGDQFYFYVRHGYVLKDYGAGVKHGEFTHRLQWYVLMAVITEDFTTGRRRGWDHSPLELYVSLGMEQNHGAWVKLFDLPGNGGFNHPDSFHHWVLNSGLANLVGFLSRREAKRRKAFIDAIFEYIEEKAPERHEEALLKLSVMDPMRSHDAFRAFDSWFARQILVPKEGNDEARAGRVYDHELMKTQTARYIAKKTQPVSGNNKPKHRDRAYQRLPVPYGPMYILSPSVFFDTDTTDDRARRSHDRLLA